ncbi:MAG: anthranilate synthase component I [Methanomicrobiaceae archaeon]|uniref:anthranilate synthase n=1 Tax=hydrocarbon metagenome TaxID=938273 RepID=A0A0W8FJD7_9ZZZZ|nr:anthranilate synthase component I [Methanomicrobiaceae archaeon]MDD5419194.1 anthranilate synthase component I [Methanomicrobiaceae archaeon]
MDTAREELTITPGREAFLAAALDRAAPLIIPLSCELDLPDLSPADVYLGLRSESGFLLESLEGSEKIARYSVICTNPALIVSVDESGRADFSGSPRFASAAASAQQATPVDTIRSIMQRFSAVPSRVPCFSGGMVGYAAYDLVYSLHSRVQKTAAGGQDTPPARFMLAADCIVFDHLKRRMHLVTGRLLDGATDPAAEYEEGVARLGSLKERIGRFVRVPDAPRPAGRTPSPSSNLSKEEFMQAVRRIKEYIYAGDIFQAVLSRRLECRFDGDPFSIYKHLRAANPSPYMYHLDFGDLAVVGSSPEMLVRVKNGRVMTVPIAGTRPRGRSAEEDGRLAAELLRDEKERAEHVMLVDLARNDLGSVCAYGSVNVDEFMGIEKFSHVQHIVSIVSGTLRAGLDAFDVLKACFPAGTVSGAPKVRAMQIIDETEGACRGIYAGAVGYFGFDGALDVAIAIRTVVVSGGTAYVQVGAGIVADSDPEREWIETENKGAAMMLALEQGGGGA